MAERSPADIDASSGTTSPSEGRRPRSDGRDRHSTPRHPDAFTVRSNLYVFDPSWSPDERQRHLLDRTDLARRVVTGTGLPTQTGATGRGPAALVTAVAIVLLVTVRPSVEATIALALAAVASAATTVATFVHAWYRQVAVEHNLAATVDALRHTRRLPPGDATDRLIAIDRRLRAAARRLPVELADQVRMAATADLWRIIEVTRAIKPMQTDLVPLQEQLDRAMKAAAREQAEAQRSATALAAASLWGNATGRSASVLQAHHESEVTARYRKLEAATLELAQAIANVSKIGEQTTTHLRVLADLAQRAAAGLGTEDRAALAQHLRQTPPAPAGTGTGGSAPVGPPPANGTSSPPPSPSRSPSPSPVEPSEDTEPSS